MKKRILALIMSVALLGNVSELSYITAYAAEPQNQVAESVDSNVTIGSETQHTDIEASQEDTVSGEDTQSVADIPDTMETESIAPETTQSEAVTPETPETVTTENVTVPKESESIGEENELNIQNIQDIPSDSTVVYNYQEVSKDTTVTMPIGVSERNYLFTPEESGLYDFDVKEGTINNAELSTLILVDQTKTYLTWDTNGEGINWELEAGTHYLFNFGKNLDQEVKFEVNKMSPITGISVTAPTSDSIASVSSGLNLEGMTMTVSHEDGSEDIMTNLKQTDHLRYKGNNIDIMFDNQTYSSGYSTVSEGIHEATVTYMGQTATMNVNFVESTEPEVTKIELVSNPTKMTYAKINSYTYINLSGLSIRAYSGDEVLGEFSYDTNFKDFNVTIMMDDGTESTSLYGLTSGDYNIKITYKEASYITIDKPLHITENNVLSIEIATPPTKTIYYDMLDTYYSLSGLELKVNYIDGSSENISYNDLANCSNSLDAPVDFRYLSPSDTPYQVTINYMDHSVKQDIYIKQSPVSDIKILKQPTKQTYIQNVEYNVNLADLQIEVTYSDGRETEIINYGSISKAGYYIQYDSNSINWDTLGVQQLPISYMGVETSLDIEIVESPVSSISINDSPKKTTYIAGVDTSVSMDGMTLDVVYTDGSTETIDANTYYYSHYGQLTYKYDSDFSKAGNKTVTVSLCGIKTTFDISVIENSVQSISVSTLPTKTIYYLGLDYYNISTQGIGITLNYKDGHSEPATPNTNGYYIEVLNQNSYFDSVGTKDVTIKYMGCTATYPITIEENPVQSIEVTKLPTNTEYVVSCQEWINSSGLELTVTEKSGATRVVQYNNQSGNYNINVDSTNVDYDTVGTQSVKVTYMGHETTFDIKIVENPIKSIAIQTLPTKTTYIKGTDFGLDMSNMVVNAEDLNGNTNRIYNFSFSNVNWNTLGTQTVTVTYLNHTATFDINIIENPVKAISIKTLPTKNTYIKGMESSLSLMGLELNVENIDGSTSTAQMYSTNYPISVSSVDWNTLGIQTITVTYLNHTTTFEIEIIENPVKGISISQTPEKTKYILGYERSMSLTGLQLSVETANGTELLDYGYGAKYPINTNFYTIDMTTLGTKTITVTCMGYQTTFDVEVINNPIESISLNTENVKKSYCAGADTWIDTEDLGMIIHYKEGSGFTDATYDQVWDLDNIDINFNSTDSDNIPSTITPGTYPVVVSYMGVSASYNVEISPSPVASIEILTPPTMTEFYDFEAAYDYDLSGLQFKINFNNGAAPVTLTYGEDRLCVNNYWVNFEWKNTSVKYEEEYPEIGTNAITLSYMGVSSEILVTVKGTPVKSLEVITAPSKVYSKLWDIRYSSVSEDRIDLSGLKLKITYIDDTTKTIDIAEDDKNDSRIVNDEYKRQIAAYGKYGADEITISYMDQQTTYTYATEEADWSNNTILTEDTPEVCNIPNPDKGALYKFVPKTTGIYKVYSYGGIYPNATIYDESGIRIDEGNERDEGFYLSQQMTAGTTYYIAVTADNATTFHVVASLVSQTDISEKTPIQNIPIIDLVEPKLGETPDFTAAVDGHNECYIEGVSWAGIIENEAFEPATKYTVSVTLRANEGFQFTTSTAASIDGKRVIFKRNNSDGTFVISYTFNYTDCQVTIPTSDKFTITGSNTVTYGNDYTFTMVPSSDMNLSDFTVKANEIILTPDSNGAFTIPAVKENQTIVVKSKSNIPVVQGEYTLSFNDGTSLYDKMSVPKGSRVSALQAPENKLPQLESTDDLFFMGWYDDQGVRFTSNTAVNSDKVLIAKWCNRVITSMYNGCEIYYKILSIDENNRVKVQVGTGNGLAVKQAIPSNGIGFYSPLRAVNEEIITIPSGFTSEEGGSQLSCEVTSVADNAFANSSATEILLPQTVQSIGTGAFSGCSALTSIIVPQGVQTIEPNTFSGCTSLTQVGLPIGVTTIGDSAFSGCSNLGTITIPETIEAVAGTAFTNAGSNQSGTEFYCSPEVSSVLSGAGITADKIVNISISFDYTYSELTLEKGETKEINVTAIEGTTDVSNQVTWTTSDGNIVGMSDTTGKTITLTGKAASTSPIVIQASYGGFSQVINITVHESKVNIGDSDIQVATIGNQTFTGAAITPAISITYGSTPLIQGTDYDVVYSDNVNVGTATITIAGKTNYEGTRTTNFTIVGENITKCSISDISSQTYNGNAITPEFTVKYGSKDLVLNTDYEVIYSNNINAGTATATITGKGNYTGTATKTFTIAAKSIGNATVDQITDVWYSGLAQQPTPNVVDGKSTLTRDKDYTVSYTNNTSVGTATITISGIGNYTGSKNATFRIISSLDKVSGLTTSNNKEKTIALTWNKVSCASGYEIYIYKTSSKKYVKAGTSSQNTYTSKKLTAGTSYKYKVRAYTKANGKTVYGKYSNVFTTGTSTKKVSISAKLSKRNATISWKKVTGASGYEIYMSTSKNGTYSKVGTVTKGTKESYVKKNLGKGHTYYFKVKAYRTINKVKVYSDYSSVKSVKVK